MPTLKRSSFAQRNQELCDWRGVFGGQRGTRTPETASHPYKHASLVEQNSPNRPISSLICPEFAHKIGPLLVGAFALAMLVGCSGKPAPGLTAAIAAQDRSQAVLAADRESAALTSELIQERNDYAESYYSMVSEIARLGIKCRVADRPDHATPKVDHCQLPAVRK